MTNYFTDTGFFTIYVARCENTLIFQIPTLPIFLHSHQLAKKTTIVPVVKFRTYDVTLVQRKI